MPDWKTEIQNQLAELNLAPTREAEIIEEIAQHFDLLYEELRADGASPVEAQRAILEELRDNNSLAQEIRQSEHGGPPEPVFSTEGRGELMADFWQDLRYALRMMRRNPGFTLAAMLSLALGIGGNAAIFSLVNSALIQPLPYAQPERLVRVTNFYPQGAVVALQQRSQAMEIAAFLPDAEFNLTQQGEAVHLTGSVTSANLFSLLGAQAEMGRTFAPGEDQPGLDRLVILSHVLWQNKFAGDRDIIGRPVIIDGVSRQVVGVMPEDFRFPSATVQLWIPLRLDAGNFLDYWAKGWMPLVARLRPGATIPQAQEESRSLIAETIKLFPYPVPPNWNADTVVLPLQENLVGDSRGKLLVLFCAVGFVLLIACANVASLLLARTAARHREIAIRAALGAGRGRLVRQLLTESLGLALAGGILGLVLAFKGLAVVKAILPLDNSGLAISSIDWRVLLFVSGLAILTGIAFGLAPALSAGKLNLAEAFKTRGQQLVSKTGVRLRSALIIGEVALSVVLVIGAGLLIKSLWRLTQVDPGFRSEQLLTIRVYPSQSAYPERASRLAFYDELLRRAHNITGVAEAAAVNTLPLSSELSAIPVELENHTVVASQELAPLLWTGAVTPEYFKVMHIPMLQGRPFGYTDNEDSERVVLVSASTAKRYWPDQNPIGKHLRVISEQQWRTIIGVVGDVRHYNLSDKAPSVVSGTFYMPYPQAVGLDQQPPADMTLILQTTANPALVANEVRQLVARLNPSIPVSDVRALETVVSESLAPSRALMWLFVSFAGTALILAVIGIYGVVNYTTSQRTNEFGIRVALGATRTSIFRLVLRQSLRLVLAGLALGVLASLMLTQMLTGYLYGVTATDPLTFVAVGALLIAVAVLAGYVPARRAASVDPMIALHYE
jgi:predicted permease